ncbi:MAG: MerR family DNA-binding protein [Alcanivorax sp.]|uniref:MerR family DNA-binding protein n=1 Tax=Alloalcanivorax marinus TaxID=1177169 RepID=A0A9Q3UPR0_9GAMM|nr:MerR family DNA-binding protein [Alloalcanivorax marinus]MBM7334458.1 MerR family DNA-binding protein [Alloalcanivorax marinus]MCC4309563.1 MerR family DNA-binding protein [Alloalcanivorax marinus]MCU5788394.1 MerR family transcriptional regulator [Alloalcanivorax marinus]
MRVTDLARRADTTAETVRHYTELGLLRPDRDPANGYRRYGGDDLRRLRFALKARGLGFTLGDVRALIEESESGATPCPKVRALIETRLQEVEARIQELRGLSDRMHAAVAAWENAPDCRLEDGRVCGLIDSFNADRG